jgi:hypothetical protein
MFRNRLVFLFMAAAVCISAQASSGDDLKQSFSPINTAVPSLSIAPDARGGAMGDNGVATLPDENSQFWNPSKYAFMGSQAGVSVSYTPWLRKLVSDVALANISGFYKIGENDNQAIGASLRYFSLGEVPLSSMTVNPYEMALDVSYSRKLSDNFSMAVALRYIRSDMGVDETDEQVPGNAYAADVSGYGERYVYVGDAESLWSYGFNISNIGSKISYNDGNTNQFLPAMLKVGTGLLYPVDEYNSFGVYLDLSKYLVPTLDRNIGTTPEEIEAHDKKLQDFYAMSSIKGALTSFSDAPGGFNEELKEVVVSLGAEYSYNDQFFLRGGYFYENPYKGNRQYFSAGVGFRMSVFQIDAAYLISTVQNNPLDQTLRFSLSFDMDGLKNLVR